MLGARAMGVECRFLPYKFQLEGAGIPGQSSIFILRHPVILQAPFQWLRVYSQAFELAVHSP